MAFFYVIGCIIILGINFDFIIPAVKTICKLAFTPGAAAGGLVGRGIMMPAPAEYTRRSLHRLYSHGNVLQEVIPQSVYDIS